MFSLSGLGRKLALFLMVPMLSACMDGSTHGRPNGYYPPQRPWPGGADYSRPRPAPGPGYQMCTMDYRPVCGERNGRLETFGNSCQAGQNGYRVVSAGECRQPGSYQQPGRPDRYQTDRQDRPGRPDRDRPAPDHSSADRPGRDRPDQASRPNRPGDNQTSQSGRPDRPNRPDQSSGACTRDYRPVCGQNGARTQTFSNACEAASAGFSVVASGECRR